MITNFIQVMDQIKIKDLLVIDMVRALFNSYSASHNN